MTGIKCKLAHKCAEQETWNVTENAQKKRLIQLFERLAIQLKDEINENNKNNSSKHVLRHT
jgi:hypothetical protein